LLKFGPYISEREQSKLIPILQANSEFTASKEMEGFLIHNEGDIWKKSFTLSLTDQYLLERDCLLELQSAESVPILTAYDDNNYEIFIDVVDGPNLLQYCKEEEISLESFREDIKRTLTSILEKGWFYHKLIIDFMIWCNDCDAFFIIDYRNCSRINLNDKDEYIKKMEIVIANFFSTYNDF
jgi:RIO-like serine/threonine protein kinase